MMDFILGQKKYFFMFVCNRLKKVTETGSVIRSRFRLKLYFQWTSINTKKVTENWFCNKITGQAKIPFQMDFC